MYGSAAKTHEDEHILQVSIIAIIVQLFLFVWFDSLRPSQQSLSYIGTGLPGLNQYWARINVSCSRTQHSDAGVAWTRGPSISSQALYHWATALPIVQLFVQWFIYNFGLMGPGTHCFQYQWVPTANLWVQNTIFNDKSAILLHPGTRWNKNLR